MSAPRIDTFRRTIDAVIVRLSEFRAEVGDLHDLAHDRHRAGNDAKVRGGSRDYALDTHGDPRARQLYIDVAARTIGLARAVEADLKAVGRYLDAGDRSNARTKDAEDDEVIDAVNAARRRRLRGETSHHLRVAQPPIQSQVDWRQECEALRRATAKVTTRFAEMHADCEQVEDGKRRKLRRRYDLSVLSPRERDAWDRAQQSVVAGDESAAS